MTTYMLNGTPGIYRWDDPATWAGGVVPNSADADVVFSTVTVTSMGQPAPSVVQLFPPPTYAIRSLTITNNELDVGRDDAQDTALAVSGAVTLHTGAVLDLSGAISVGSLSSQGNIQGFGGAITSAGAIVNDGTIGTLRGGYVTPVTVASGGFVDSVQQTLAAATVTNNGNLTAVLIETPRGGFTNLSNGTLSGGSYTDIALNVGGLIVTDGADLSLTGDPSRAGYSAGPVDEEYDSSTGTYVPIESTLRTIATSGSLTFGSSYTTSTLSVSGVLKSYTEQAFAADQLTIASGGRAVVNGTFTTAIEDDGVVTVAPATSYNPVQGTYNLAPVLTINGAVTGAGTLEISAAANNSSGTGATLELDGAASANVVFDDRYGTLTLDQPGGFTGAIAPSMSGGTIDLPGIALSSVTGETYSGNGTSGTLTLTRSDGPAISLKFLGRFSTSSFGLSAGPQQYSTSPPSLIIAVAGLVQSGNAFYVDGSAGTQTLTGTGSPNFINTSGAAGTGDVAVDLAAGTVTKGGQLDATFTNIQGVQLGADVSAILGLTSGTDLLYGGTGPDTFNGNGATDYIQGGTGTNIVQGGSGNEVFYGNGGNDVMRGGSAANFMSGGSIPSSTDVFYGTTGNDFVYANGGAVDLVGGSGSEFLSAGPGFNELDDRNQIIAQGAGASELVGNTGTDLFYAGVGINIIYEGSGTDTFVGSSGTDQIYGGTGRSFTYAGSGTDVLTTGAGNDYVQAGSGALSFNDTAANLHAGRFDEIDGFSGSKSTDLYLPTVVQGSTSFVSQNGGTAILTAVGRGSAEVFVSNATVAQVQAHTHFTL